MEDNLIDKLASICKDSFVKGYVVGDYIISKLLGEIDQEVHKSTQCTLIIDGPIEFILYYFNDIDNIVIDGVHITVLQLSEGLDITEYLKSFNLMLDMIAIQLEI